MDLGPIDITHGDPGPAAIAGAAPARAGKPHPADSLDVRPDSVATHFGSVSAADIAKLTELIGRSSSASAGAHLHELARSAGPPPIDPIQDSTRSGLEQDPHRHAALARLDAEARLALAEQRVGLIALERLSGWQMRPETMVAIGHRIFDAGGPANYARAAMLAQIVIDGTRWAPGVNGVELAAQESVRAGSSDGSRPTRETPRASSLWLERIAVLLRSLWLRAPLLVLLFSWFAIGITGGVGSLLWRKLWLSTWPGSLSALAFDTWGIGFLLLVLLGFYARVRHVRF
jgi:hypothetical protein